MRPTQHRSNNAVLGAPPGVSHDECVPLRITRIRYEDGLHAVISYWQPDAADLERLAAGKPVAILIWGVTHPPVYVGVDGEDGLP